MAFCAARVMPSKPEPADTGRMNLTTLSLLWANSVAGAPRAAMLPAATPSRTKVWRREIAVSIAALCVFMSRSFL